MNDVTIEYFQMIQNKTTRSVYLLSIKNQNTLILLSI